MIFFNVILENGINLGSKTVTLQILRPIDVPDIAVKLNLLLWTHRFQKIVHLFVLVKPVSNFERLKFVSDLLQFFHKLIKLIDICLLLLVANKGDGVVKHHGLGGKELGHTYLEISVFSRS